MLLCVVLQLKGIEFMEISYKRALRKAEKALYDLSSLYEGAGYEKYKMRKGVVLVIKHWLVTG